MPLSPDFLSRIHAAPTLPDPLPPDPMPLFKAWFDDERTAKRQPNPNAMTLATVGDGGLPDARIVLCRGIDAANGVITFFTNYQGRKGRELAALPAAALVFHWDHTDRQVRIEGPVVQSPSDESDAYFRSRRWESRLSAWVSQQSQPIAARADLMDRVAVVLDELRLSAADLLARGDDLPIPRPPHWGGFRVWARRVELWTGGPGRFHDRARWDRPLIPTDGTFHPGPWSATRLQP